MKKKIATVIAVSEPLKLRERYGSMKAEEIIKNLGKTFVGIKKVTQND